VGRQAAATLAARAPAALSLLVALAFVVHPVQTEAVTYVCQRFTSLATLFCLLSFAAYAQWRLRTDNVLLPGAGKRVNPGWWLYWLSLCSMLLAMYTKEISFTMPLVLVLYEWMFFGPPSRRQGLLLLPFLATMLIIPLLVFREGAHYSDVARMSGAFSQGLAKNEVLSYLLTQFRVVVTYIRLLLLPAKQNLCYDYPRYESFLQPPVFLSFAALSLVALLALRQFRRALHDDTEAGGARRMVAFGIFWFFITLAVESSFMPLNDLIFEHRLYLPSAGVFLALAGGWRILGPRLDGRGRMVALVLALAVLAAWGTGTILRNQVWRDPLTLWKDSASKSPGSFRANTNLGIAYMREGQFDEAADALSRALPGALRPTDAVPIYDALEKIYLARRDTSALAELYGQYLEMLRVALGKQGEDPFLLIYTAVLQAKTGNLDEAESSLRRAIDLNPNNALAHANLGSLMLLRNNPQEAVRYCRIAAGLDPEDSFVQDKLGDALAAVGNPSEALQVFEKVKALDPETPGIHLKIAELLLQLGRGDEAGIPLAVQLRYNDPKSHSDLGYYYAKLGRFEEAENEYLKAMRINDKIPEIYLNMANLRIKQQRFGDAVEILGQAVALDPRNPEVYNLLGMAYFNMGDYAASARACQKVAELSPEDEQAKVRLAEVLRLMSDSGRKY